MPTNPNMVAIQTVTVGSGGAANIEFTNIPQTYTDLCLKISSRDDRGGGTVNNLFSISLNNSTSNFSNRQLWGSGSAASSVTDPFGVTNMVAFETGSGATASTFANTEIYIPNYTSSNNKSISIDAVSETNGTTAYTVLNAMLWSNSAAITSIKITPDTANFVQYSTATLYGVTSAGYGAKATGGIITQDANYFYHTFLSSGTFTPTSNITADYLVVAGGGGGGTGVGGIDVGGGGGGGGLRCTVTATGGGGSLESALSLTASTNYTVTVGGGGAANTSGSNSVFSTITSTGGGRGAGNNSSNNGGTGGSGGGGRGESGNIGTTGGAGTANQGYAGGNGSNASPSFGGGGGGGANVAGSNGANNAGGNGGNGVTTSISGSSTTYAGGGGGGNYDGSTFGTGGSGGGGRGGYTGATAGVAGTGNTGGGGGGGGFAGAGSTGGSGIVVIRYAK